MKKKRILIAFLADPLKSPRPRQMIHQCLTTGCEVSLYCLPSTISTVHKIHFICESARKWKWQRKLGVVGSSLLYFFLGSRALREKAIRLSFGIGGPRCPFQAGPYDAVIVQDLFLLPYCLSKAGAKPVLFDAREFYPKQREGNLIFDLLESPLRDWICKEYLSRCAKIFTVSNGLASAYETHYGVAPTVLRSTPPLRAVSHPKDEVDSKPIRIVHVGAANPNRKIENMLEIFRQLKGSFTFDLYLVGPPRYIQKLRRLAGGIKNLRICEPIAPGSILSTLENYDVGFYYLEPKGLNLMHSLPNKFFEFIQARLAIAIGPSPEMKILVEEFGCGFVAPEFTIEAMARTLDAISSENLRQAKVGSDQAAQVLCSEIEWQKVNRAIEASVV